MGYDTATGEQRASELPLATAEMEHEETLTATITDQASAREKLRLKFAAKGATPAVANAQQTCVLPLRPTGQRHCHKTPFVHSMRSVMPQVPALLSTPAALSKKCSAASRAPLNASQLQESMCCVGIACCMVLVLSLPVAMATITMQSPNRRGATVFKDDLRCRRDANLALPERVNRTRRLFNPTSARRQLPARTPHAAAARGTKLPTKTPTISRSNEDRALTGLSCTSPMRRDRTKSSAYRLGRREQNPVVIFTHLRRTGGSVLEKGIFWPGVACDQGVVLPLPLPQKPVSVHRATPGGRIFYQAEVSNKLQPSASFAERRSAQQVT